VRDVGTGERTRGAQQRLRENDASQGINLQKARRRNWRLVVHHRCRAARANGLTERGCRQGGKGTGGIREAEAFLTEIPYRGSLGMAVPTDPTIYRFYEIVQVYGSTLKELIHEEFGDGIMSAIDFDLDLTRQADPNGDRVRIVMTGKFLKYKKT